jgi:hypothetical protein
LANIAVALTEALSSRREAGSPGGTTTRVVASGDGWTVADVVCTSGPQDHPFEEQHARYAIAVVVAGIFRYRSPTGRAVMTPGSLMLGNAGHCFDSGFGDVSNFNRAFRTEFGVSPRAFRARTKNLRTKDLKVQLPADLQEPCAPGGDGRKTTANCAISCVDRRRMRPRRPCERRLVPGS